MPHSRERARLKEVVSYVLRKSWLEAAGLASPGLAGCTPRGCEESDTTVRLNSSVLSKAPPTAPTPGLRAPSLKLQRPEGLPSVELRNLCALSAAQKHWPKSCVWSRTDTSASLG